jgi:hypothetical protein
MLALVDGGPTPMLALTTLLGKRGQKRAWDAIETLAKEGLVGGFKTRDDLLFALPVEAWTSDEHFLIGAGIAWP